MRISRVVIDLGIADLNEMLVDFLPDARLRVTDINENGIIGQVKLLLWNIDFAARPNSNRPDELSLEISASKLVPIPSMIVQRSLRDAIKDAPNGINVIQQALKVHLPSILNPLGIYVKIRELQCHNGFVRVGLEGIRLPTPDFSKKETETRDSRDPRQYSDRSWDTNGRYGNAAASESYGTSARYGNGNGHGTGDESRRSRYPGTEDKTGEGGPGTNGLGADQSSPKATDWNRPNANESGPQQSPTPGQSDAGSSSCVIPNSPGSTPSGTDSEPRRPAQPNPLPNSQSGSPGSQGEETRTPDPAAERRLSLPSPENEPASSFLPPLSKDTSTNASIVPPPIVRVSSQGHNDGTRRTPLNYTFTTRRNNT